MLLITSNKALAYDLHALAALSPLKLHEEIPEIPEMCTTALGAQLCASFPSILEFFRMQEKLFFQSSLWKWALSWGWAAVKPAGFVLMIKTVSIAEKAVLQLL